MGSNPTLSATYRTVRGSATDFSPNRVCASATESQHESRLSYNCPMPQFFYVYVLQSLRDRGFYVGSTENLRASVLSQRFVE